MLVQLTNYGAEEMSLATAPLVLEEAKLGSAYDYTPAVDQADIMGTLIYACAPAAPVVEDGSTIKYSVELNVTAGPFTFGEVGLYYQGRLFAVCVMDTPIQKIPLNPNTDVGGAFILDIYIPMVGDNYQMWANVTQANTYKVSTVVGPEELPVSKNAVPNIYVVQAPATGAAYLAYTDRVGLWNFQSYSPVVMTSVIEATATTVTVNAASISGYNISALGEMLVQIASGKIFGTCRYISAKVISNNGTAVLSVSAPFASIPTAGDLLQINILSALLLGPAQPGRLGMVKPGSSMTISPDGTLNVREQTILTDINGVVLGALVAPQ